MVDETTLDGRKTSWTAERRAAAAERCRANKPWQHSTGPTSEEGKMRASLNATKHGNRTNHFPNANMLIQTHEMCLNYYTRMETLDFHRMNLTNELINKYNEKSANILLEQQILAILLKNENLEGRLN